jgi:hypothetical protein
VNCLLPPHPGKTCDEKATDDWLNDPDNVAFRRCPKCTVIIERTQGCKFMICKSAMCASKTYFCMVCMKILKSHHEPHTCTVEGYAFLGK